MKKIYLNYETAKEICIAMADELKKKEVDHIIAINRGGITFAHIMAKYLHLDISLYNVKSPENFVLDSKYKDVAIVEDVVTSGNTIITARNDLRRKYKEVNFYTAPLVIDRSIDDELVFIYGIKTKHWIVFPFEELEKVQAFESPKNRDAYFRDNKNVY